MKAAISARVRDTRDWSAVARAVAAALFFLAAPQAALAERSAFGQPDEAHSTLPASPSGLEPSGDAMLAPVPPPALEPPMPPATAQEPAAVPAEALAALAPLEPTRLRLGVFGSNMWAGRGVRRTASAYSMPPLSIGLNVGLEFFSTKALFVSGDTSTESEQHFALSFSPVKGMEIAVAGRSLAFQYRDAQVPRNLMLQGNPGVQIKYGHHITGPLALGARVSVMAPASATGSGLAVSSLALRAEFLISVQPLWFLEWTTNLGYVYDRANQQYKARAVDAVQRFVYSVNTTDRATWATAVTARFPIRNKVDITPFVEFAGEVGTSAGATAKNMPSQASVGVRVSPTRSRAIELTIGSDVAITGGPQVDSPFGGLPPYQAFAQLSVHFHDWAPAVRRHKDASANASRGVDTFQATGNAYDQQSGRPVQGLRLGFVGEGNTLVTSETTAGRFVSFPLARAGSDIRVHAEAPGYLPLDEILPRPPTGDANLTLRLSPSADVAVLGSLKGIVRHAYTAQPVDKARVEIEGQDKPLLVDRRGAFSASLRPGSYRIVIRAAGFLPQHRSLVVASSENVVLNVDLEPTSR